MTSVQERYLEQTPVQDIWGVGWRYGPKLRAEGCYTALDLSQMRPKFAQSLMGIHGRQLIAELHGTSCHPLTREGKPAQSIASTRTFGEDTNDINAIEAAITTFVATASFRLRRSQQLTKKATLFITTNKHKPGYASWSQEVRFDTPTADGGQLNQALVKSLRQLYSPVASYHRAGIMLYDFVPDAILQTDILGQVNMTSHEAATRRMQAVDDINRRFGKRHMRFAAEDLGSTWKPKYQLRSPRYTTKWDELPKCKMSSQEIPKSN